MDVMASRVALGSGLKKEKALKNKTKKLSKPAKSVKSPPRVTKKKNLQITGDKFKSKKEVIKETLKNEKNGDSSKLYEKVTKPLKKVVKNKKTLEIPQAVKTKKIKKDKEITKKIKKEKSTDNEILKAVKANKSKENKGIKKEESTNNEIPRKVKKEKSKEFVQITQKTKKQKVEKTEGIMQKMKKEIKKKTVSKNKSTENTSVAKLSPKHVKQGVAAILQLAKDETNNEKLLLDDGVRPIFLQVLCIKIPKTPTRQLRMLLPHTLVTPDDDVALIVKDLERGRRKSYEPTVDHFEQLLKDHKCTQIKTVIPMNQIKTEYDQYELKRNLVNSYDYFLVDGRISGHVSRLLGKIFSKKRKLPTSIRMGSKDLKHEIHHALSKTSMKLNSLGDTHTVQIGTTCMKKSEIVENIVAACNNLAKNFPGGWSNIRSLMIKTPSSLAIPIYITMKSKNKVTVPVVGPKRPKAYQTYEDELTTLAVDTNVSVTPDGVVTIKNEMDSETEDEDEAKIKINPEVKSENEVEDEDEEN